jgi:plasmid stabilization system protein ParE
VNARQPNEVRISAPAFKDIGDIWVWTVERFGLEAALRYEALIEQSIADLADDPGRPAAKERADLLPGLWFYHLALSQAHVREERAVHSPRHFLMFRHLEAGVIEIVRILHDSRDFGRHLPAGFQAE